MLPGFDSPAPAESADLLGGGPATRGAFPGLRLGFKSPMAGLLDDVPAAPAQAGTLLLVPP